jgi:hypothetical protein
VWDEEGAVFLNLGGLADGVCEGVAGGLSLRSGLGLGLGLCWRNQEKVKMEEYG